LKELASIRMMQLANGQPGVKLESTKEFMDLEPIDRATLINAALQLCVMAINAIADDHPEDADDIMERLESMVIEANRKFSH